MDMYEFAQYTDQNILHTALINQKEIDELVGDEELLTIHEIHHGFHMSSRYKIGISLPNEDSFYDSFRQGLEEHGILATVYELKETCKSFAFHPPKWFEEEIVNRSNETRFNENWAGFLKTVYVENNWNDPLVQGWILCNKYNVKLYLIENNIDEENEYYVTRIVQNYSCEIVLSALIVSGQTKITIVNFGNHHFYPLVDTLAQMLKGKFGDVNYNKISRNKKKVNNIARGPTILENRLNYDVKPDILVKLNSVESTIKEGDINTFKKLLNDLYRVNRNALIEVFHDPKNNIKNTNLVVLACKYNKLDILQYLINDFCPLHNFPLTDIKNNYKYKDNAIFYATLTFNKDMLVTLYDHFVDELHWSFNHHNKSIVENLKELNTILVKTSVNCEITLQENRQMSADLRCLIEVSKFQIELYTELDKIRCEICNSEDKRQVETETTINIILTVIRIHNKYNLKYIKLNNPLTVERRIQIVLADKTSNFMENNHKFVFDLYYRKLDLNAALLILDNLHYLQQRLELPSKYYNEIESALYYFIYRVYEDWRLFLPQNRMITRVELLLESHLKYKIGSVYDKTKLLLGPVLHLSRTYFCDELKKFGEVLQTTEIEKNIRKKGKKLSLGEINKLTLLPLMRDHFSLKKILAYLESMSKVDLDNDRDFAILMIERTIQVIGELLKISNESIHISLVTESLIEFMIPSETIRYLRKMRDILSRFKIPQLLKRIHIMNAESDCFKQVLEDLNDIKERIYYSIEMYHPILDKWILEQGLSILDKRIKELPVKNKRILKIQLLKMPPLNLPDSFIEYEDKIMKEHKISRQLLREINTLYINHNELTAIYKSIRIYSKQQISAKMDTFSTIILEKLRYIEKNAKLSQCLDEWEFIVKIFEYIFISMRFFDDHPYEIKHSAYSNMIENIKNKNSIRNGLIKAFDLLAAIQNHAASYNITKENLLDGLTLKVNLENEFTGIKFLKIELQKCYNFIINEELKYVINNFKNAYGNEADVVYTSYENVLNKIKNNIPIQSRDYKAICSLNLNDESKRIISYLDSKGKRTLKLGYCFENRIRLLKQLSGIDVSVHNLASRYKHDERFRLCLEMLLIDIMNILKHIEQKATLKKENKLYTDANIRNILEHSEPLLEDIGKALDPNDFATTLAKKAIEFVGNAEVWLDALNKLNK